MHVMPEHLLHEGSTLRTPEAFFKAAKEVGYTMVIGNFRENQLARDVSAYEKKKLNHPKASWFQEYNLDEFDLVHHFKTDRLEYNSALDTAARLGFVVVPISFGDIIKDTCGTVRLVLSIAASKIGVTERPLWRQLTKQPCTSVVGQHSISHRKRSLEWRTSQSLAGKILSDLQSTEFSWMLNTSLVDWPLDVAPTVPVATTKFRTDALLSLTDNTDIDVLAMRRQVHFMDSIDSLRTNDDDHADFSFSAGGFAACGQEWTLGESVVWNGSLAIVGCKSIVPSRPLAVCSKIGGGDGNKNKGVNLVQLNTSIESNIWSLCARGTGGLSTNEGSRLCGSPVSFVSCEAVRKDDP